MTIPETVLLAIRDLEAAGNPESSESDVTVAAWSLDRVRLGMRGYEQSYPDHKRCYAELCKLVKQKLVSRVRPCVYKLSKAGAECAKELRK